MKSTRRGFTLIELMIVVVIVGVLAAVAYPLYTGYVARGKQAPAKAALVALQLSMESYRAKYGSYPAAGVSVDTLPGYSTAIWQSIDPSARYYLSIEESNENYYRIRATCQPPQCNIDDDNDADVWESTSTSGSKPLNIVNDAAR
jgi:type IV pilus assembly protein PilE